MENKTKKWIQKSSQCKKFAIFSIIIFILEKEKSTQPPCTHPLDLFYILTLFWSWQTVWDTKLLSWKNHQPKIKTCFNYCIAASKCASVCKFCRKMSGNTTKNTTTKNTTSINRNKWNSFTVYIYLPLHNALISILKEHSSELDSTHCLLIHSRTHIRRLG